MKYLTIGIFLAAVALTATSAFSAESSAVIGTLFTRSGTARIEVVNNNGVKVVGLSIIDKYAVNRIYLPLNVDETRRLLEMLNDAAQAREK